MTELILEFDKVVENVAEKTVENVQGTINLRILFTLDELEEQIQKVLPDRVVLLRDHGTLNLDSNITDLVHVGLVCRVDLLKSAKETGFHSVASVIGQALPEVDIVLLVLEIAGIGGLRGDITAEDDCGEGLGLDGDTLQARVENTGHQDRIFCRLRRLCSVELPLGNFALLIVVAEDLLEDASDAGDVFCCDLLCHSRWKRVFLFS